MKTRHQKTYAVCFEGNPIVTRQGIRKAYRTLGEFKLATGADAGWTVERVKVANSGNRMTICN